MLRIVLCLLSMVSIAVNVMAQDNKVYELRTYTSEPGRQKDTLKLMEDSGLEFMKKAGVELVAVWTPVDTKDERVFMLVRHADKATGDANWTKFQNDEGWKLAVQKSAIDGKKPVQGIERVFLSVNDYSPSLDVKKVGGRVFELRTYVATKGNLSALNNRFRNHTLGLFTKYGMTNVVYWSVRDGEKTTCAELLRALSPAGKSAAEVDSQLPAAGNSLVYFLTHASPEAAAASFGKFRDDADWNKARTDSEKAAGGSLTVKDGVKSLYLKPVAFSPLQ